MALLNRYDVGSVVRIKVAFVDVNAAPIDPGAVTLGFAVYDQLGYVKTALTSWTVSGGQIVKDSTGNYHADLDSSAKPGVWDYHFAGTTPGQATADGQFVVVDTPAR